MEILKGFTIQTTGLVECHLNSAVFHIKEFWAAEHHIAYRKISFDGMIFEHSIRVRAHKNGVDGDMAVYFKKGANPEVIAKELSVLLGNSWIENYQGKILAHFKDGHMTSKMLALVKA